MRKLSTLGLTAFILIGAGSLSFANHYAMLLLNGNSDGKRQEAPTFRVRVDGEEWATEIIRRHSPALIKNKPAPKIVLTARILFASGLHTE